MLVTDLSQMVKGWFVGSFSPTAYETKEAEVAVKRYRSGDAEAWHVHRIATEITVVVSGAVRMGGSRYDAGAIIRLEPGEGTDFTALEDSVTVVVKLPSVRGDKYTTP
jgi:hypothetical protein